MTSTGGIYDLGIDLGTTYAAAGVLRQGRPEVVTLGDRSPVVPSVLYFKEDGEVLTGEPANRRGLMDPSRVVREFKRRVGDTTPLVIGKTPYSAEALLAKLLRFVYDTVTERQGSIPAAITITHPANWGSYKIDVLRQAIRMADVGNVQTITEPVAAAIHYAASERLESGQAVAVYDLGGGTFDAAVVRKVGDTFEVLGDVEGIEQLGGIDLDEAIFQHVVRWCESAFQEMDYDDQATLQAVGRLRQECVAAKEALSADTDVAIPVVLPNLQTEVRLTRAEFEAMIRPLIQQTVEALRRAIRGAGVDASQLAAVLLVGGSSQIPLVAEMVGAELGRPIAVDQHPKHTVALGAAIAAGGERTRERTGGPTASVAQETGGPVLSAPVVSAAKMAHSSLKDVSGPPAGLAESWPSVAPPSDHQPTAQYPVAVLPKTSQPLLDRPSNNGLSVNADSGGDRAHPFNPTVRAGGGSSPGRRGLLGGLVVAALLVIGGVALALRLGGEGSDSGESEGLVASEATAPTVDIGAGDTTVDQQASTGQQVSTSEGPDVSESTTGTETDTSTTEAATTTSEVTTSTSTTTVAETAGLTANVVTVTIVDGRYSVDYTTNFDPLISSDPGSNHLHFFFDTVDISQAGVPGSGPWILYDGPSPFTQYSVADKPTNATRMCVTAATHGHAVVDTALFHCLELPSP